MNPIKNCSNMCILLLLREINSLPISAHDNKSFFFLFVYVIANTSLVMVIIITLGLLLSTLVINNQGVISCYLQGGEMGGGGG